MLGGPGETAAANQSYQNGVAGWLKGDVATASAAYDRAIVLDRTCYRAYVGRGLARAFRGKYDDAVADYRMANALTPAAGDLPYETVALYRTEALLLAGRLEEADLQLRSVEGKTAQSHGLRGMILVCKGDRAAAARAFADGLAKDPNLAKTYYTGCGSMVQHQNFEYALLYCDAAELTDPRMTSVAYVRGRAYAGLGKKAEAIAAYTRYLEVDSTSEWARHARQSIADLKKP